MVFREIRKDEGIRLATPEDAENLLKIYTPYVENTAISFEYSVPTLEDFRNRIIATLKNYPYLVYVKDGQMMGYCYASTFHTREAYKHSVETSIYVSREAHGLGIGRALYEKLEELLLKQNVFTLYACVTCTDDPSDPYLSDASLLFHEHMGYRKIGMHEHCGYKFDRWYSIQWLEKLIAERPTHPEPFVPFPECQERSNIQNIYEIGKRG